MLCPSRLSSTFNNRWYVGIELSLKRGLANSGLSDRAVEKAALTVLLFSIAFLAALYQRIYPLELTLSTGYVSQIPLLFWPVIVLALGAGFFACIATPSNIIKFTSVILMSIMINFSQFIFFNFTGGDSTSETTRWFLFRGLPRFSIDLFDYFQWPIHFIYFETVNKLLALPLIDTVRVSYLMLYISFIVGVMYLFHAHTSISFWAVSSLVYVMYMMKILNNQLVPQLSALVILLFLFGIGSVSSVRTRAVQFLLYLVLVLTHPFFFIFYLIFVAVYPFVNSARTQLVSQGRRVSDRWPTTQPAVKITDKPVYRSIAGLLSRPSRSIKMWLLDGVSEFKNKSLFPLFVMSAVYLILIWSRFIILRERIVSRLVAPGSTYGRSGRILSTILSLLTGDSGTTSQQTQLLYSLSSETLHSISALTILMIFVSLLVVSLVAFFRKPASRVSSVQIAAGLSGLAYYIGGFVLPLIGNRALQVALLPIGTLLAGREADAKVIKIIILVALLLSPVLGLNALINSSISGGGNSQSYHGHVAGEHLTQYELNEDEVVLTYPRSALPPDFSRQQDETVVTLEEVLRFPNRPSTIVYGPRQELLATRYFADCNFAPEKRNRVYDNKIAVLTESTLTGELNCTTQEAGIAG